METKKAKFTFSPRILDHLGISAYNSVRKCLAELATNAYDADSTEVNIYLPDIIDNNATIKVEDNGLGMNAEDLVNKFLYVGRDRREEGDRTAGGRLTVGSKGIGKLAGFGIASRIRITSRKNGKQVVITIDRSDLDSIASLENHEFVVVVTDSEGDSGTTIELINLHEGLHMPEADVIRRHLYKSMPRAVDFAVFVNDIECSAEDVHGERSEFSEHIEDIGQVSGFYIIANSRQTDPGFSVRVRGRIVQEPTLFGLDTRTHGFFTAEKIVGEIRAEFLDPEGADLGRHDLIKTSRDGFLEDSEVVQKFNDWASKFVRKIVQGIDQGETKKRTDALMSSPEIKERLDALPAHIRGTASSVVRSLISKLKTASDEDAKNLIEWILRYYESNVLKELMKAIASANINEAKKLAELVSEWGLSQLNSVAGIIETQISIITRLEELVASDKSYEIDLHKLIEKNLWLVQEGLELWSSDKPLKRVLDDHMMVLYKDKEDIRPDIVCRSRDDGNNAVILEFKRPREKIVMDHVAQALEYEGIISAHRPNVKFTTYVVGREYHPSVLAIRHKQAAAGLNLLSFEDILQKARIRFEGVLDILGR